MNRVVFFDHLDTRAAVLGDLVDGAMPIAPRLHGLPDTVLA